MFSLVLFQYLKCKIIRSVCFYLFVIYIFYCIPLFTIHPILSMSYTSHSPLNDKNIPTVSSKTSFGREPDPWTSTPSFDTSRDPHYIVPVSSIVPVLETPSHTPCKNQFPRSHPPTLIHCPPYPPLVQCLNLLTHCLEHPWTTDDISDRI